MECNLFIERPLYDEVHNPSQFTSTHIQLKLTYKLLNFYLSLFVRFLAHDQSLNISSCLHRE